MMAEMKNLVIGNNEYEVVDEKAREDVATLKSTVDAVFPQGKNLFDISTITEGYFVHQNTGAITANSAHNVSDYIPIVGGKTYTISVQSLSIGTNAQIRWFCYDETKAPISGSGGIDIEDKVATFSTPENAYYLRFSYVIYSSGIMLEEGDVATSYEEFSAHIPPKYIDAYTREESDARYVQIEGSEPFDFNLPPNIYAVVGVEMNVYFENIIENNADNYEIKVTCDKGEQRERCYRIVATADDVGEYPLEVTFTNNEGISVTKSTVLKVVSKSAETDTQLKVIVLGDSTTAGGVTVQKMHTNFEDTNVTIQTLGTCGTSPNNHEGRSGWSVGTYLRYAEVGGVANAFYDGTTFNATHYFQNSGVDIPDWFIINLGINDLFAYTADAEMTAGINNFINGVNQMITSVQSVSDSIKIGLAIPIPPNYSQDAFGKAYKCRQARDRYKRNNFYLSKRIIEEFKDKEDAGVYLIPLNVNLDTVYNMGFETIPVNARSTITYESPIGNGGIHPVESGYWQAADVYTAFLFSKLSEV